MRLLLGQLKETIKRDVAGGSEQAWQNVDAGWSQVTDARGVLQYSLLLLGLFANVLNK